jgi:hypothetical protein
MLTNQPIEIGKFKTHFEDGVQVVPDLRSKPLAGLAELGEGRRKDGIQKFR